MIFICCNKQNIKNFYEFFLNREDKSNAVRKVINDT